MARVLIAEDERSVSEFVSRGLKLKGFEVTVVEHGGLAYEALAVDDPPFDLLLADIIMPIMDGVALALAVKDRHPNLPILLMTGYTAERERAHDLSALIEGVLLKPFTLAELIREVERVLNARAPGRR